MMAAMLFVYLAFEAYLNDVGPRVCPDEWNGEKRFFGGGEYRGTLGKLRLLLDRLHIEYDKGKRPYQTVVQLDQRRDKLVHGRTEVLDRKIVFRDPRELESVEPEVYAFAEVRFLDRALKDVESLCDHIQSEAQRSLGVHAIWSPCAFRGMIGHQGGSIIEMPSGDPWSDEGCS